MLAWVLLFTAHAPVKHACIHSLLNHSDVTRTAPRTDRRRLALGTPSPLRVHWETSALLGDSSTCYAEGTQVTVLGGVTSGSVDYTCQAADVLTPAKRAFFTNVALPAIASWLAAAFSVRAPVVGSLRVERTTCGFGGGVAVSDELRTIGVRADVILFVSARPIVGKTVAFGGYCQEDGGSLSPYVPPRPNAGHINVDPQWLVYDGSTVSVPEGGSSAQGGETGNRPTVEFLLLTLLHEVFHALGFSADKLKQFACPSNQLFERQLPPLQVLQPDGSIIIEWPPLLDCPPTELPPVSSTTLDLGAGVTHVSLRVHTPTVMLAARQHFNCPLTRSQLSNPRAGCSSDSDSDTGTAGCMFGVELEDGDGSGATGSASHWEKRILREELMTSSVVAAAKVSTLTLAAMQDSGWYEPDFDVQAPPCHIRPPAPGAAPEDPLVTATRSACANGETLPFSWGLGLGCRFVSDSCATSPAWKQSGYFCPDSSADACTADSVSVGYCDVSTRSSPIPPARAYFGSPLVGGSELMDFCPVVQGYIGSDCRFAAGGSAEEARALEEETGQRRSVMARCVFSSLAGPSVRAPVFEKLLPRCYEQACSDAGSKLRLRIGGNLTLACPSEGGEVSLGAPEIPWLGAVRCPSAASACGMGSSLPLSRAVDWPAVHSMQPSSGSTQGGTLVTITGLNFDALPTGDSASPASVRVSVRGAAASVVAVSATSIVARTPRVQVQLDEQSVTFRFEQPRTFRSSVVVTNAAGQSAILVQGFTFVEQRLVVDIEDARLRQFVAIALFLGPLLLTLGVSLTIGTAWLRFARAVVISSRGTRKAREKALSLAAYAAEEACALELALAEEEGNAAVVDRGPRPDLARSRLLSCCYPRPRRSLAGSSRLGPHSPPSHPETGAAAMLFLASHPRVLPHHHGPSHAAHSPERKLHEARGSRVEGSEEAALAHLEGRRSADELGLAMGEEAHWAGLAARRRRSSDRGRAQRASAGSGLGQQRRESTGTFGECSDTEGDHTEFGEARWTRRSERESHAPDQEASLDAGYSSTDDEQPGDGRQRRSSLRSLPVMADRNNPRQQRPGPGGPGVGA